MDNSKELPYGEGSLSIFRPSCLLAVLCSQLSGTMRMEAMLSRATHQYLMLQNCPSSPELPTAGAAYKREICFHLIYNIDELLGFLFLEAELVRGA